MGRRKIEIKAIKDDRNRSVTFLKRKGGLFKKAHELSVLCSVDVAVFIFGNNKKLYEYSSCDMRELITRYTYHGGPNEHKGPSDFNGGGDDDEDEDGEGTPPHGEGIDSHMLPPHFAGQQPFQHVRHHTPSASPPIQNGVFVQHPGHQVARGHTPQPPMGGSRPSSRNDMRRMPQNMVPPQGPPQPPPVNGYAFMPQPAIYNPQNAPSMPPNMGHPLPQPGPQYPYPPPQPAHAHQMGHFMDDQRRSSLPPSFPPPAPQQAPPVVMRHSVSPPQPPPQRLPPQQLQPQPAPHASPRPPQVRQMPSPPRPQPQPQHQQQPPPQQQQPLQPPPPPPPQQPHDPQPPAPMGSKADALAERPRQPPLLDTGVKRLPPRKGGSIFTPIEEGGGMLDRHFRVFNNAEAAAKSDAANRSQSLDVPGVSRPKAPPSPPMPQRANTAAHTKNRTVSVSSIPETTFTPPSRSNSLRVGGPSRPRLKVQIPDEPSDGGSATAESGSPRGASTDATSQSTRRNASDSHSSGVVLPPPSPSASALLSAGATGPPNPFARPPPQQHQSNSMSIDTPVSALPSRFLNNEFLPSPSSFYPDWNFRGSDSNTLPSPLNFATPNVATGPSFLRDDPTSNKRKSPEVSAGPPHEHADPAHEPKRIKVDS